MYHVVQTNIGAKFKIFMVKTQQSIEGDNDNDDQQTKNQESNKPEK